MTFDDGTYRRQRSFDVRVQELHAALLAASDQSCIFLSVAESVVSLVQHQIWFVRQLVLHRSFAASVISLYFEFGPLSRRCRRGTTSPSGPCTRILSCRGMSTKGVSCGQRAVPNFCVRDRTAKRRKLLPKIMFKTTTTESHCRPVREQALSDPHAASTLCARPSCKYRGMIRGA